MTLGVLLVDDSLICRERLRSIIEADGDLSVVAETGDGAEAVELVRKHTPAVLVTDLLMPHTSGHEVIESVMSQCPVPIVVVTGKPGAGATDAFEATRRGALEFAEKPTFGDERAEAALRLCLRRVVQVPVIKHPRARVPARAAPTPAARWTGMRPIIIGIGASAGGPPALAALLAALPRDFGACIAIAQHTPSGYAEGFASFLRTRCRMEVQLCRQPTALRNGTVFVPPDDRDLAMIDSHRLGAQKAVMDLGLAPSVDVLLGSLAERVGPSAAGVVLSGIGTDGARGLAALRQKGALTVVQDAVSCGVYGMPKAAAPSAAFQMAPEQIAQFLVEVVAQRWSRTGH